MGKHYEITYKIAYIKQRYKNIHIHVCIYTCVCVFKKGNVYIKLSPDNKIICSLFFIILPIFSCCFYKKLLKDLNSSFYRQNLILKIMAHIDISYSKISMIMKRSYFLIATHNGFAKTDYINKNFPNWGS